MKVVPAMARRLGHRGPDAEGHYRTSWLALGHTRLAIQDVSPSGSQPMVTPCGRYVIVYNGEIYNVADLRRRLEAEGIALKSTSDTEVVLQLFALKGLRCVDHLEGMFAFAVADLHERRLFLCRDRCGEKPLFYGQIGEVFYFASEIKAFHEIPGLRLRINPSAVIRYFLHTQVPPPFSFFEEIGRLEPGHWMSVEPDGRSTRFPYWKLDFTDKADATESELRKALDSLVFSRVQDALVSDCPQGILLSGGVDSSLIYAAARATSEPLACFTIAGSDDTSANPDFAFAQEQARRAGHPHHVFRFRMPSIAGITDAMVLLDEPIGIFDSVMSIGHCRSIAAHRRVVLSGSGADEVFGGYDSYADLATDGAGQRRATMDALLSEVGSEFRARSLTDCEALFAPGLGELARGIAWEQDLGWLSDVARCDNRLDAKLLTELLIGMSHCASMFDSVGMAASVEIRSPFLNHRIIEFAARLPCYHKVASDGPHRTKTLLKQVADRHLPSGITRRKKTGYSFGIDPHSAIAGLWSSHIDDLLDMHRQELADLIDVGKARHVLVSGCAADAHELERRRSLKLVLLLAWLEGTATRRNSVL